MCALKFQQYHANLGVNPLKNGAAEAVIVLQL